MANINIFGVDERVKELLEKEATSSGISINSLVLRYIYNAVGYCPGQDESHVQDHLAGTWSQSEYDQLMDEIKHFNEVDASLWK
ncbi:hypothetical protein [Desulfonatronovibrio magnus]|uniref:hypothetical protein n=1 Tax=Desulfonatronovibrio magnus TaxID=698827 RepID=UPI0005EBC480|nr:hypothetical protein [Desulfonatronovibrio magnus]RQD65490.1 MAG: hypothetical protein D5R98_03180 [Desulfonatronovibrio sp. MSAO_Bac4]